MRFSYEDIFGNKYYQDLPFTYMKPTITLVVGSLLLRTLLAENH